MESSVKYKTELKNEKKDYFSIGLTFFRVLVCFTIIKNFCFYLPVADPLFGSFSLFPYQSYVQFMHGYGLSYLIYPFHIPFAPQVYLIVAIAVATCYMLAVGGRVMGFVLYMMVIILKIRNGFILDGSDNVIQVTLPFLVLADNLNHFRLYNAKPRKTSPLWQTISGVAVYGLMIQVSYVYFFTAMAKLQGDLWLNGTATYYTMRVRDFMATDWNIYLTQNHYFVVSSTYFTLLWEMAFPFLIWFRQTRLYIIAGGIMLHGGIWLFMRIDNFSWVMISTYFVFVTNTEYKTIQQYLTSKLYVYIDGWCPNCSQFGNIIKKLDFFDLISIRNIRQADENMQGIREEKALQAMASVNDKGQVFYGFDSIYQLTKRIPVLWLLLPGAYLLKISHLGGYFYKELAVRRKLIPLHCEEVCTNNEK